MKETKTLPKIVIDEEYYIYLHPSGTFDLRKEAEVTSKVKGETVTRMVTTEHGYHSTLKQAIHKYASLKLLDSFEEYTLKSYIKKYENVITEAFDAVRSQQD